MKRGINLRLPKKKTSQAVKKAYSVSIGLFLATFAVGIFLVGVNLFIESRIAAFGDEEANLKSQILSQNAKLFKLYDTHARLTNIKKIVDGRSKIPTEVDYVAAIVPQNAEVSEIDAAAQTVGFTITTSDLGLINNLLEQRLLDLSKETDKSVKRIEMKSLELDAEERVYDLDFEVTF